MALLSTEQLYRLVWKMPAESLSPFLNISGSALSRACRSYGVPKPSTGYWQKVKAGTANAAVPAPNFENKKTRYKLTPELMRLLEGDAPEKRSADPATVNDSSGTDARTIDSREERGYDGADDAPLASAMAAPEAKSDSTQTADQAALDQERLRAIADDYLRFLALNQLIDVLCSRLGTLPASQGAFLLQWIQETRDASAALDPVARLLEKSERLAAAVSKQL